MLTINNFSFRLLSSLFFSFFFSLLIGFYFLKFLNKFQLKQCIRNDGPKSHLIKNGTPTMGGIVIICSIIITILLFSIPSNFYILYVIFTLLSYGIIGFIDDYFKLFKNSGLHAKTKYLWLSIFAIIIIYIVYIYSYNDVKILFNIQLLNDFKINKDNKLIFFILSYFMIVGFSNSVNLTDGLDGLAIILIILVCIGMFFLSFVTSNINFSYYFNINYDYNAKELLIVCLSIIGSSLGFLWFNTYPAKIFMGDVGSLPLGAVIGLISILLNQELLLMIIGGFFILESLSVIIQIVCFKLSKKKIFLMAPIHHHYELKGHLESTIVTRIWIISSILLIIGLSFLLF